MGLRKAQDSWLEEAKQTSQKDTLGVSLAQRGEWRKRQRAFSGENGQYKGWAVGTSGLLEEAPRLEAQ